MAQAFKRGDHLVSSGELRASKDDPRYLVRSEKSGKETVRRAAALTRVN